MNTEPQSKLPQVMEELRARGLQLKANYDKARLRLLLTASRRTVLYTLTSPNLEHNLVELYVDWLEAAQYTEPLVPEPEPQLLQEFIFNETYRHYPKYRRAFTNWSIALSKYRALFNLEEIIRFHEDDLEHLRRERDDLEARLTKPLVTYVWNVHLNNYDNQNARRVSYLNGQIHIWEGSVAKYKEELANRPALIEATGRDLHNKILALELETRATWEKVARKHDKLDRQAQKKRANQDSDAPVTLPLEGEAQDLLTLLEPTSHVPTANVTIDHQEITVSLYLLRQLLKHLAPKQPVKLGYATNQDDPHPIVLVVDYGLGQSRLYPIELNKGGAVRITIGEINNEYRTA